MVKFTPYNSPVDPALYPTVALVLMIAGLVFSALFFVQQVTATKASRNFTKEVTMAAVSSIFMGLGMMFTMLAVGIYV